MPCHINPHKVLKTHNECPLNLSFVIPGNTGSLWKAVKIANDVNISSLPQRMYFNQKEIEPNCLEDMFAQHFDMKIKDVISEVKVELNSHIGKILLTNSSCRQM
jgi:hypothetical protein